MAWIRRPSPASRRSAAALSVIGDGALEDARGVYAAWFGERGCSTAIVRPDWNVYGAATEGAALTSLLNRLARRARDARSGRRTKYPEPRRGQRTSDRRRVMQGKVALEEHFAIPDTVQDSAGFVPGDYWIELKARLLDMQDRRLREMDKPTASR